MDNNDIKVLKGLLIGVIAVVALIVTAILGYYQIESANINNCVKAGGSWTDINPGYNTDMGCVNK